VRKDALFSRGTDRERAKQIARQVPQQIARQIHAGAIGSPAALAPMAKQALQRLSMRQPDIAAPLPPNIAAFPSGRVAPPCVVWSPARHAAPCRGAPRPRSPA
jgi:hypothetical protein